MLRFVQGWNLTLVDGRRIVDGNGFGQRNGVDDTVILSRDLSDGVVAKSIVCVQSMGKNEITCPGLNLTHSADRLLDGTVALAGECDIGAFRGVA